MRNLQKYFLDYEKTFLFVKDTLEESNTLSTEVLKSISFRDGFFFTLLPEGSNLERLYEFRDGIVLPQNPLIRHENSNACYSITPNIRSELSFLIRKKVIEADHLISIFDDILSEKPRRSLPESHLSFYYEKEIYYAATKSNISAELVKSYLGASNAFWHSLCVLTTARLEHFQPELSLEDLTEICANMELIITCAYDGEGYIFWEKNEGFFL